jgi:hypothetical protein
MKRYNLSEIMKNAHRSYKYSGKQQGKTFGECLKSAWRLAKLQSNFTVEAVKERTDKYLAERHEAMSKTAKATMHEGYNNKNIPASAYYNVNSTGRFGSRYVGD